MSNSTRKSVVELAKGGKSYGRQALWETMRRLKRFCVADLRPSGDSDTVREYLRRLEAGGFLEREGEPVRFKPMYYRLVRDTGLEAPRLGLDGAPSGLGKGREQMWRAMKMLPSFNVVDLAVNASTEDVQVAENEARDYVKHLERAKYLAIVKPATHLGKAVYRLTRNTGPRPPMVTRAKIVFDPNLGKVAWCEEVDA